MTHFCQFFRRLGAFLAGATADLRRAVRRFGRGIVRVDRALEKWAVRVLAAILLLFTPVAVVFAQLIGSGLALVLVIFLLVRFILKRIFSRSGGA